MKKRYLAAVAVAAALAATQAVGVMGASPDSGAHINTGGGGGGGDLGEALRRYQERIDHRRTWRRRKPYFQHQPQK